RARGESRNAASLGGLSQHPQDRILCRSGPRPGRRAERANGRQFGDAVAGRRKHRRQRRQGGQWEWKCRGGGGSPGPAPRGAGIVLAGNAGVEQDLGFLGSCRIREIHSEIPQRTPCDRRAEKAGCPETGSARTRSGTKGGRGSPHPGRAEEGRRGRGEKTRGGRSPRQGGGGGAEGQGRRSGAQGGGSQAKG